MSADPVAIPTVRGRSAWRYVFEVALGSPRKPSATPRPVLLKAFSPCLRPGTCHAWPTLPVTAYRTRSWRTTSFPWTPCGTCSWAVTSKPWGRTLTRPRPTTCCCWAATRSMPPPVPELALQRMAKSLQRRQVQAPFTARMRDVAERYYHDRYVEVFGMPWLRGPWLPFPPSPCGMTTTSSTVQAPTTKNARTARLPGHLSHRAALLPALPAPPRRG